MRVFGITLLLAGLFFVLFTVLSEPESVSRTVSWAPWIGVLVFLTGGISYYVARNEK